MNKKIVLGMLCIVLCMVFFGCASNTTTSFQAEAQDSSDSTDQETESSENQETDQVSETSSSIFVYVCGQVLIPGVYELSPNSRIIDAIESAGGFTDKAAQDYWNQAEALTDGQMIYVPTESEALEEKQAAALESTESQTESPEDGLININTATKEELITLSGIGDSRATAIIDYRTENGDFKAIEDITLVSGIGETLFEKIKDKITI